MIEWNTNLDVFSDYPRCCTHFWADENKNIAYWSEELGNQYAFYCPMGGNYRIIEEECLGADCPFCKLVGIDDYHKLMDKMTNDNNMDIEVCK